MSGILPILIIYFIFRFVLSAAGGKKGKNAGRRSAEKGTPAKPESRRAVARPEPVQRTPVREKAFSPERTRRRRDDNCDYGDINHQYSHDHQRRMEQLDSFLKNGIIDRAEYNVLKERYQRAEH